MNLNQLKLRGKNVLRTFHQWQESLPSDIKEIYHQNGKNGPPLNRINYIWVTNLMNYSSEEKNPTIEELLEWIKTEQVDAKRK